MPVLRAEMHNLLVKFRLLLSLDIREKTQNPKLCPQTFDDGVHTLRLAAKHTHTHDTLYFTESSVSNLKE